MNNFEIKYKKFLAKHFTNLFNVNVEEDGEFNKLTFTMTLGVDGKPKIFAVGIRMPKADFIKLSKDDKSLVLFSESVGEKFIGVLLDYKQKDGKKMDKRNGDEKGSVAQADGNTNKRKNPIGEVGKSVQKGRKVR